MVLPWAEGDHSLDIDPVTKGFTKVTRMKALEYRS